ncbi:MAG: hypothetical protein JW741_05385 [Sedimentisphaerales bacterium]|nr:hypothetical protein [Sedimentisphaerales bacterium]
MKRLYWTEPSTYEFEVAVKAVGDGCVTIDPIVFHPDEGGQPADTGTIGEAVVRQVEIVDDRVIHTLDRSLADGTYVARVDRRRRNHTACHHTAQHILSGVAAEQFGLQTTGVHIGLEACTVDFGNKIDWDVAEDLERRAMAIVMEDLPVETVFGDTDEPVRSRFGAIDADVVRVVKIGDCDKSPCCGAHVRSTGRIGVVRIFNLENKKEGTRASFLAGQKALEQSQRETAILRELRKAASCSTLELPAILEKALERAKELSKEVDRVWSLRLSDLARSVEVVTAGSSKIGVYVGALPRALVATLAGMIAESVEGAGIAVSDTHIAVSSTTLDAGQLFKQVQKEIGGKGGGSPRAAQGRLDNPVTNHDLVGILARCPAV